MATHKILEKNMKIPPTNSRTRECVLSNDGLKIKAKLDQFHHYEIAKLIIEALGQSQLTVNVLVRMFVDDAIETINKLEERKIELVSPDKATDEHHPLSQVVRDFYERVKAQVISLERKLIIASSLEGKATKYKVIDLATAKKFITELENFSDEAALRQVTSKPRTKTSLKS
ncbi:MAG: hypothetical protein HWD59_03985 [Coxiellaceae bacterium]|nr:MAG: hypothetical protein HWD59_03985 [Coxiellaceae bacterium]